MANTFLNLEGLQHYDSKIKSVAAGNISIEGLTITLLSVDGKSLGTVTIPQTKFEKASATADGLMSKEDFSKLSGIAEGATNVTYSGKNGVLTIDGQEVTVYVPPTQTALSNGLYKITTNSAGAVTVGTAVKKEDITALGIPGQDTTYSEASATTDGLLTSEGFVKLEGISEGATKVEAGADNGHIMIDGVDVNVYEPATQTALSSGLYKITTNAYGAVTAGTAVKKDDITALGIPAQDTTYGEATANNAGLMSAAGYSKLDGIEAGADVNVLESVSVNGQALTVNSKGVNIDLSNYALKTDIASAVEYKGSVDKFSELPTNAETGDMYNVVEADAAHGIDAGTNVVWNGASWDAMAPMITISGISNSEIDAMFE